MCLPVFALSQECYTVTKVSTQVEMEEISKNRIIFGIKQIMEDVISDKYELCMDGKPITVIVKSIEAPTTSIEFGSEEHTSELQSRLHLVCRLLLGAHV